MAFCIPSSSRADDGTGIDDGGAFDTIAGYSSYECYYFDIEKVDILDTLYTALNAVTNVIFSLIKLLTKLTMAMLYYSLSFDAGEMLSPYITGIQESLNSAVFEPLFILAFCGVAVILIKRILKRDLMGALGDIIKVIAIVVLSVLAVKESDVALSKCTEITKEISIDAMTGINTNTGVSTTDYALSAAELIWQNLVAEPWEALEFAGTTPADTDIENFLNIANPPGSDNRANLVASYSGASVCFSKSRVYSRIAFLLVYFIPFLCKCAIYMLVGGIQLIMQVVTVVYILLAPLILLLALIPGYENIVYTWLRKILETQLAILIITFLMGLIIKIDSLLFGLAGSLGGFLVVCFLQMTIIVGIYLCRDKIMAMMSGAQRAVMQPNRLNASLNRTGDFYGAASRDMHSGAERSRYNASRISSEIVERMGEDTYYENDDEDVGTDGKQEGKYVLEEKKAASSGENEITEKQPKQETKTRRQRTLEREYERDTGQQETLGYENNEITQDNEPQESQEERPKLEKEDTERKPGSGVAPERKHSEREDYYSDENASEEGNIEETVEWEVMVLDGGVTTEEPELDASLQQDESDQHENVEVREYETESNLSNEDTELLQHEHVGNIEIEERLSDETIQEITIAKEEIKDSQELSNENYIDKTESKTEN